MRCSAVWCNRELGNGKNGEEANPGVTVPRDESQIGFSLEWRLKVLEACFKDGLGNGYKARAKIACDARQKNSTTLYKSISICRSHFFPNDLFFCGNGGVRVQILPGALPHRSAIASNQQAKVDAVHNEATGRATRRRSYSAVNSPVKRNVRPRTDAADDVQVALDPADLDNDQLLTLNAEYKAKLDEFTQQLDEAVAAKETAMQDKLAAKKIHEQRMAADNDAGANAQPTQQHTSGTA